MPFALQEEADGLAEPAAETSVKMYSVGAKIVPLELKAVLGGDCKCVQGGERCPLTTQWSLLLGLNSLCFSESLKTLKFKNYH